MVATFAIPKNIDPILLEAWLRRERKAFLQKHLGAEIPPAPQTAPLPLAYAGYLSMTVMIMVILLGLLSGTEPAQILQKAFYVMICFFGIGFLIGFLINSSVRESAREMVLEVVRRSEMHQAGPADENGETAATQTP